jgi:hypothetical protein
MTFRGRLRRSGPIALSALLCLVVPQLSAQASTSPLKAETLQVPKPLFEVPVTSKASDFVTGLSGALPGALAFLNTWGIQRRVEELLAQRFEQIKSELDFAGDGGVLIIANVQSREVEAGKHVELVGDTVEYVGIGATPIEAKLAALSQARVSVPMTAGWKLDEDMSTAFWIKRHDGSIGTSYMPLGPLRRGVLATYSERTLAQFDWSKTRNEELERLIRLAEGKALDNRTEARMRELIQSKQSALAEREKLNIQLQKELDRAARTASGTLAALSALATGLDLAAQIAAASKELASEDKHKLDSARSPEELKAGLSVIEDESVSRSRILREEVSRKTVTIDGYEVEQIEILRLKGVPTQNVPSGHAPALPRP